MDAITEDHSVLVGLYEVPEKPANAIDLMKVYLGTSMAANKKKLELLIGSQFKGVLTQALPFPVATLTVDFELTRYTHLHTRVQYDLDLAAISHVTNTDPSSSSGPSAAATSPPAVMATAPQDLADAVSAGFITVSLPLPHSSWAPSEQSQEATTAVRARVLSVGQLLDAGASFYSSTMTPLEMSFLRACLVQGTLDCGDAEQRYLLADAPPGQCGWPNFDFSRGGWSDAVVTSALRKLELATDGDAFDRAFRYYLDDRISAFAADPDGSIFALRSRMMTELYAEAEARGEALSDAFQIRCDWSDGAVITLARALWQRRLEGEVRPPMLDHPVGQWFLRFAPDFPDAVGALLLIGLYRQAARAHPQIANEIDAIVERVRDQLRSEDDDVSTSSNRRPTKKARLRRTVDKAKGGGSSGAIPAAAAAATVTATSSTPSLYASSVSPSEKPPCMRRLMLGGRDRLFEIDVGSAEFVDRDAALDASSSTRMRTLVEAALEGACAAPHTSAIPPVNVSASGPTRHAHQPIHLHLAFAFES